MVDVEKLKKGDKVRFTNASLHEMVPRFYPKPGTIGIVHHDHDDLIQWPTGSTSLDDLWCAPGHSMELVASGKTPKIVIMVDKGDPMKVTAKDLDSGKVGEAKCSPDDTFDFLVGAEIAFDRLCKRLKRDDAFGKPCKFKAGDIIVGNAKANRYEVTREGWVGKVVEVFKKPREGVGCDEGKPITFKAARVNREPKMATAFDLCDDAFDLA